MNKSPLGSRLATQNRPASCLLSGLAWLCHHLLPSNVLACCSRASLARVCRLAVAVSDYLLTQIAFTHVLGHTCSVDYSHGIQPKPPLDNNDQPTARHARTLDGSPCAPHVSPQSTNRPPSLFLSDMPTIVHVVASFVIFYPQLRSARTHRG
ncbi:hypothetical protein B0H66DRAFT_155360 [Apodospora peruviana]|uniref:Uncharacterized protein n=1 Tax=Apodospora peruviana TaxID=516989 RepID=A0AAE0IJI6_9PEZI|nr:hypothetical protein B0H66DRAFT_155360 [Apodospora peruviana]